MTDHTITQPTVETKPKWGDAWILRRDLRLDRAMVALAPAVSAATFVREYGSMIVENVSASREPLADLRHHYVRALNAATGEALFVGVITAETDDPHGPDVSPSGDQRLAATGLECFLTSAPVDHAYVHVDDKVVRTDRRMTFNAIAVSGRGLVGNRSKAKHGGTYVFSRDGDLWTAADVAEYLLARFAPPELAFELSGAIGSLAARVEAFDAARTVYEGLCALADPRRGVAWGVTFPGGAGPKVELFSLFAQAVGGGEPNAAQAAINLDAAALAGTSEVRIRAESANRYKRVVVRGSPVVLCTSYRGDQDLEKAWTDGLEAEYAALDVGGDPEATEKARRAERYRDVYRALRIPKDRHTTTTVSVDDEGEITFGKGALTTLGKAFYGRIPLVVGHDYSAGELPANAPAGAPLVEYRKPLVVVSTPPGAAFEAVDDPNEWADWPAPAAGVEILDGEPGFRLRVEPGYLWALGSWGGADHDADPQRAGLRDQRDHLVDRIRRRRARRDLRDDGPDGVRRAGPARDRPRTVRGARRPGRGGGGELLRRRPAVHEPAPPVQRRPSGRDPRGVSPEAGDGLGGLGQGDARQFDRGDGGAR